MLIHFNENSVIPQRKQMGNCAGVWVCEHAYMCVFMPTYEHFRLTGLPLLKHMCMDVLDLGGYFILPSSTICKYSFLYLLCMCMFVCVYTIKGFWGLKHSKYE